MDSPAPDSLNTVTGPPPGEPAHSLPAPDCRDEGAETAPWDPLVLVLAIRKDQAARWERGERPRLNEYLQRHPALAGHEEALLDLIAWEWQLQVEHGAPFSLQDYLDRFPRLHDALRRQFEASHTRAGCAMPRTRSLPPGAEGKRPVSPMPELVAHSTQYSNLPGHDSAATVWPQVPPAAAKELTPSRLDPNATISSPTASPKQPSLPAVPGFEILGELGRGGMGVVYKARQLSLNRLVALKMLKGSSCGRDQLERFRLEAEAVARLHHPNIVQIHEIEERHGEPYCCLEYVEGGSLDRKLAGQPQAPQAAAQMVAILAQAMQAAHDAGIIHRDLKPANVLLTATGVPKVSDFGLAKQIDDESWRTHSGAVLGTPSYMAPEQAAGKTQDVTPRADIYSLGAVLYEMLTGRPPFRAATLMDTLEQVRYQEPVAPRRLQPKIPRDLETICLKCLQKEPRKRYASATELADDLSRFLAGKPILARPTSSWERAWKWGRRNPALAGLLIMTVLAVLGFAVGALLYLRIEAEKVRQQRAEQQQHTEQERLFKDSEGVLKDLTEIQRQGNWPRAQAVLREVLARIGERPLLKRLQQRRQDLLKQLHHTEEMLEVTDRLTQLRSHLETARFHATLVTGQGLEVNLKKTRQAVQAAFGLWGLTLDQPARPTFRAALAKDDQQQVLQGCYEMLLLLAEVEVQPRSGISPDDQLRRALTLLDCAAALGRDGHPTHAYLLRRARYLHRLHRDAEARQADRLLAAHPPATALDYYLIGDEHYKQGRLSEAVKAFEEALLRQPSSFWAHYFAAMAYLSLRDPVAARAHLAFCLSASPNEGKGYSWLHALSGYAHTQLGAYQEAEQDYARAFALDPEENERYVLFTNRALMWIQAGQYEKAKKDLAGALKLRPAGYQARITLAQVHKIQGQWRAALATLERARKDAPDQAFLPRLIASLHREKPERDLEAALRAIEQAVALDRKAGARADLARDLTEKGLLHYLSGDYDRAVKAYAEATACDVRAVKAYLGTAQAQIRRQRYGEALRALDAYQAQGGPPSRAVLRLRGLVLAKLGRNPEAIDAFTQALGRDMPSGWSQLWVFPRIELLGARGSAHLVCRAYTQARADLQAVVAALPADADARAALGFAQVKLGQYEPATANARAALHAAESAALPSALLHQVYYFAARIYAQAFVLVDSDGRLSRRERDRLRRAYASAARVALSRARAALPEKDRATFWRDHVRRDLELEPLRGQPGF